MESEQTESPSAIQRTSTNRVTVELSSMRVALMLHPRTKSIENHTLNLSWSAGGTVVHLTGKDVELLRELLGYPLADRPAGEEN